MKLFHYNHIIIYNSPKAKTASKAKTFKAVFQLLL